MPNRFWTRRQATRNAHQRDVAQPHALGRLGVRMVVRVRVLMVMRVSMLAPRSAPTPPHQARAKSEHEQPRHQLQGRDEHLRNEQLTSRQRYQPDGYHRGGMGLGDTAAEQKRMARRSPTADEIARQDRFAMPGRQPMQAAEHCREQQR